MEPEADVEVNVPGDRAMLVEPVVFQLSVLLAPPVMVLGDAEKELMTGSAGADCTVTDTVAVAEPAALLAVRV